MNKLATIMFEEQQFDFCFDWQDESLLVLRTKCNACSDIR